MSREEKLHTILTITKINDSSGQKLIHVVADTKSVLFGIKKERNAATQQTHNCQEADTIISNLGHVRLQLDIATIYHCTIIQSNGCKNVTIK